MKVANCKGGGGHRQTGEGRPGEGGGRGGGGRGSPEKKKVT